MSASAKTRADNWLDPATLVALGKLELIAKAAVEGFVQGLHRSPRTGFSQEFAEYRAYNEGDDLRHIDWGVFGRTDRLFLRQYEGETNTRVTLVLDCSASMAFGSGRVSKLDVARFILASVAYMANQQHDAIGLMTFNTGVEQWLPPATRHGQLGRLLHALESTDARDQTDPIASLEQLAARRQKAGIVIVASDFYTDAQQLLQALRPLAWQGHDMVLVHVLDPAEMEPSFASRKLLEDQETGQTLEVDPTEIRAHYPERLAAHLRAMERVARGLGADYLRALTSESIGPVLGRYLRLRGARP